MQPTSEERSEVAERLRGEKIARNSEDAYVVLLSCIGIRPQLPAVRTYKDAMARMADLIDPTCHLLPSFDGGFGCDRCYTWYPSMKEKTNYCPNCGARVVEMGDD